MLAYRILQLFLRLVVSVFFRNIDVVGSEKIPQEGGIIFAGNHPNSLMDPVLVITHSGRVVHFAAKDVLFKSRFLRFFLKTLGAVPVQRKQDHDGSIDNRSMFAALFKILERGGSMGIFPEGISHMNSELSAMKTGTARIALESRDPHNSEQPPLHIVPVGLTYLHRQRFRSQVLIHFGDPIEIDSKWQHEYAQQPKETVYKLTEHIGTHIHALTVNAPDWETLRMLHTARRLYKPCNVHLDLETYAELMRRFSEGYIRAQHTPELQRLRAQLETYQDHLDQLGLLDHDVRKNIQPHRLLFRFFRRLFYLVILVPLALPGAIIHAPVGISAVIAGDHLTVRKDVVATTKLISAILLVPLLYACIIGSIGYWVHPYYALCIGILLPLTGFATVRVLEQQLALGRSLKALYRITHYRQELAALRILRAQLVEQLDEAVDRFRDVRQERIFAKN